MTDTTLADKIEALAKAYSSLSLSASNERVYDTAISIANCVQDNLPTILRALRERDQAVEALRLFVRLMNDPDYDLGELCEEFCTRAETILASIEGTGHDD